MCIIHFFLPFGWLFSPLTVFFCCSTLASSSSSSSSLLPFPQQPHYTLVHISPAEEATDWRSWKGEHTKKNDSTTKTFFFMFSFHSFIWYGKTVIRHVSSTCFCIHFLFSFVALLLFYMLANIYDYDNFIKTASLFYGGSLFPSLT